MKYINIAVGLIAVGLVGSYTFKVYDAKGGDPLAGKEKYVINCLSCHGDKGYGDGVLATALPHKPSNIARDIDSFFNYDSVLIPRIVLNGKIDKGMPAFKDVLTHQDAKDIFAYIRSVNK